MMLRNEVSRLHVAHAAIKGGAMTNKKARPDMHETLSDIRHDLVEVQEYIMRTGKDPEDAYDTPFFDGTGSMLRIIGCLN